MRARIAIAFDKFEPSNIAARRCRRRGTILIERAQGGIGNFGITELARGIHQHRVSAGIARFVIAEVESLSRDRKPLRAGLIGLYDVFQILSSRGPHSLRAIGRETILESREARISRRKWETNSSQRRAQPNHA